VIAGGGVRKILLVTPLQFVALCGRAVAMPVERTVLPRKRAENPVEQEKSNAEIAVHAPLIVQHMVVNVVQPARLQKPDPQQRSSLHPKILQVHTVVQVAEHEDRPDDHRRQRQ